MHTAYHAVQYPQILRTLTSEMVKVILSLRCKNAWNVQNMKPVQLCTGFIFSTISCNFDSKIKLLHAFNSLFFKHVVSSYFKVFIKCVWIVVALVIVLKGKSTLTTVTSNEASFDHFFFIVFFLSIFSALPKQVSIFAPTLNWFILFLLNKFIYYFVSSDKVTLYISGRMWFKWF